MDVDWAGNGDHKPRKVLDSTSHNCNAAGGSRQKSPGRLGLRGGTRSLKNFLRKSPSRNQRRSSSRVGSPGRDGIGIGSTKLGAADRFIPNRAAMDFQASHYLLTREESKPSSVTTDLMSPRRREYQGVIKDQLAGELSSKVLAYQTKPPMPREALKIFYRSGKSLYSTKKFGRRIPKEAVKKLDAPDIINDYYLNLMDWSSNNHLAVALGAEVYIWNAVTEEIQQVCQLEGPEEYVASVKWVEEGSYLALGTSTGNIQLWDVEQSQMLRCLQGLDSRVASLSWNKWLVAAGCRSGEIQQSDTRMADHVVASCRAHSQEVCGLAWSTDGKYLASGGNDNILNIWASQQQSLHTGPNPLHSLTSHMAAVKALAWCPWQSNVLASGGSTADGTIKMWNTSNGQMVNSTDTKSQVCSLVWAGEYKELVSSHGSVNNEIIIWKYPTMAKTAELMGHTERVLHLCLSPDGSSLISAGADETLQLWECFTPDPNTKKPDRARQSCLQEESGDGSMDEHENLVSPVLSDKLEGDLTAIRKMCEQDIKERVLIVNQTLLDCHDRLLAELDKTVRETELAGESKVGRISFCATDLSPDNILGFLTVDGLLPSHLNLRLRSPITDLKPGNSLMFTVDVEADTGVTLKACWYKNIKIQVSFMESDGREKLLRMKKKTDGTKFLLKFDTSEVGIYKVTATLYDNHIRNSPIFVSISLEDSTQSKMNKTDDEKSINSTSVHRMCEMTENDLMNIDWQQGKTLPRALKSLAKFLTSIDVVEVEEKESTKTIVFKVAEKKKLIKILKIYSRNETNSLEKLHSLTPRLVLSPSKTNGMFALAVTKKKDDQELVGKLRARFPDAWIEEKSHVRIVWLPTKLEYFRALVDKSLNVNFLPSSQNYLDVKPQRDNLITVTKESTKKVVKEILGKVEDSQYQLTEKAIFGFLWRSLGEDFKIKDEQVISRQLTEFIKNVECSNISYGDEGLIFHFATQEDFNILLAQYCPEFVGDPEKLSSLSKKFTIIPSKGQFGIFNQTNQTNPINVQDFLSIAECRLYHNTLWFNSMMDLIKALRDENINRIYSALYIDCRNILILQPNRPKCPAGLDGNLSPTNYATVLAQRFQALGGGSSLGSFKCELNTLFIAYNMEKDLRLAAKLMEDLSWFDDPLYIQLETDPATGISNLKFVMKNKEVTIAAFLGLKLKYPGLEIEKTEALVDLKPDKNGLYTLMFKDKKRKRYSGTLAKFGPFCSRPETAPIICRGESDDIVYVSFQNKDETIRALKGVSVDEDFLELQVAPDSRN